MSFIAWKCQNLLVCTWPSGMAAEVWALSDNDVTSLLPNICVTTYVDVISINQSIMWPRLKDARRAKHVSLRKWEY